MSSPKNFVFTVLDPATGLPKTGLSLSFVTYKDETGANVSPPSISNITGSGGYAFTPVFPTNHGIYFEINTGNVPTIVSGYLRPEDYASDSIPDLAASLTTLLSFHQGTWIIQTAGPDANRIVYYAEDGVTVLAKFDLKHADGTAWSPVAGANTQRVKV
jgi:hypothetical protein